MTWIVYKYVYDDTDVSGTDWNKYDYVYEDKNLQMKENGSLSLEVKASKLKL